MTAKCCPLSANQDGPSATVYTMKVVAARKAHRCTECGEDIAPGVRYERVTGLWDGRWSTHQTCLSCVEIRNHFECEGWLFGQLWSDLEDNFYPDMKAGGPCMEGLSPEAKDRLITKRMEWLLNSRKGRSA